MRWLLAGYCGLALIHMSVAVKGQVGSDLQIKQNPRFYGRKAGHDVLISCLPSGSHQPSITKWYKADKYNGTKEEITPGGRMKVQFVEKSGGFLYIYDVRVEDNGVYFCQMNNKWGAGTEIQVVRPLNYSKAVYRSKVKDGLIILQALLLAVFIAALLLHRQKLQSENNDSIYEEPETDHIYEGLTIETCGGGLYEELSVYAQAEGTEAPWE